MVLTKGELSTLLVFQRISDSWVREVHKFESFRKRRHHFVIFRDSNNRKLTSLADLKAEGVEVDASLFKNAKCNEIVSNKVGANKRARREAKVWAQEIARQDKLGDRMNTSILEDVNILSRRVREETASDEKNGEASLQIIPELPTRDSETEVGQEGAKRESPKLVRVPSQTENLEEECTPEVKTVSAPEDTDTVVVTPVEDPPCVVSHLEGTTPNEEEVDDHFDNETFSGSDKSYHAHINLNLISAFVKLAAATVEEEDVYVNTSVEETMMAPIEVSNPVEEVAAQVEEVTAAVAAVLEEFANPIQAAAVIEDFANPVEAVMLSEWKSSRTHLLTDDFLKDNEGTQESDGEVDASSGYSTIEDSSLDLKLDEEEDEDVDGQGIFSLTEIEGSFANALQGDESFVLKESQKDLLAPAEA